MATLPDKWVRKAIYTAINDMVVNTKTIPCYDVNAPNYNGKAYVLLSSQTSDQSYNKCEDDWISTILLDIVTIFNKNTGSRVLSDDIAEEIISRLENLTLENSLVINRTKITFPQDFSEKGQQNVYHRKLMRYEFLVS